MKNSIFFIFIITISIYSCDKFYAYDFKVDNRTNENITIIYRGSGIGLDTLILDGDKTATILHTDLGGKCSTARKNDPCPSAPLDSINEYIFQISMYKNDTLINVDYNDIDNWEFESSDQLGIYTAIVY